MNRFEQFIARLVDLIDALTGRPRRYDRRDDPMSTERERLLREIEEAERIASEEGSAGESGETV